MRRKWMFIAPLAITGIVIVAALGGGVVMLLWNWLMPPLFGRPEVTFWQGLGLLALCRILFGGMGRHGAHRSNWSPEAKQRFRQRVRERFGLGAPAVENQGQ